MFGRIIFLIESKRKKRENILKKYPDLVIAYVSFIVLIQCGVRR